MLYRNHKSILSILLLLFAILSIQVTSYADITPVSDRTAEVRDAIVAAIPGVNSADEVTETHLAAITSLNLRSADITALTSGDFSGMTGLTSLNLYNNELSSLPDGIFEGLTALTSLRLGGNTVDPLPIPISLEKIEDGQFKAVALTGAPYDIVIPISATNGSIADSATSLTIAKGSTESGAVTVSRTADTTAAVTANIGTLPGLPQNHYGYALTKSDALPLEIISPVTTTTPDEGGITPVSDRTPLVRDTIVNAIRGIDDPADVTEAHLATITTLSMVSETLTSLSVGDFDGLTGLTYLNVFSSPNLTMLPSGIFDGLTALTKIKFEVCGLTSLPAGIFDDLTSLEELILVLNELSSLPAGIFDDLTALTTLDLSGNRFTTIPSGILVNLTSLTNFYISDNYDENNALIEQLPLPISLELVQSGEFKAVAPTGAPFDIVVPVNISNGTISGSATSLTISKGSVESASLKVTATDPNLTVSVGIGTLPGRPSGHNGYVLTKGQTIKVIDNGNAAPIFTDGSSTTRSIAEDTASGVNIGSPVDATDADNQRLTYTLGGTDAASFSIAGRTGQLQTNASLDYETKSSYSVTVTATDTSGASNNSATITVTISVTEVNEAPAFASASTTRSVAENTVAGTAIGAVVSATDANNDLLTYTLGGDDAASFDIDSMTGQLKTNAALDYETKSSYSVTVTATDTSEASNNSTSITVTINVTDVNERGITPVSDRTPLVRDTIVNAIRGIDDPADVTEAHLATITTLSMVSETLTSLSVGDFDGLTGLTYLNVFSSPNLTMLPSGIFDGLTALTKIKFEVCGLTSLPAGIFDDLTSLEELILVLNELSSLPAGIFDDLTALTTLDLSGNRFTTIPSGILVNLTSLTNFYISDNYDENNALIEQLPLPISLELVQSGEFKAVAPTGAPFDIVVPVNISNGTISGGATSLTISKGSVESASLKVTATDPNLTVSVGIGTLPGRPSGHNGYVLTKGQTIKVIDNGNAAPIFTDGSSTTRIIDETNTSGLNIGSPVDATDADNERLTYTLDGADAASFSIVRRTGQLQTNAALDYETKSSYSVTVTATDTSKASNNSASITVTINVTEVNEAPAFASASTTRSVAENTVAGTAIGAVVSATDADNDPLTYTLGGDDAASFDIDSMTGQLKTNASLDYETKSSYSVTVTATDTSGASNNSATITVTINVTDVVVSEPVDPDPETSTKPSKTRPVFTDGDTAIRSIAENQAAGTNIGTAVSATDVNEGDTLTYILRGVDAASFDIDSTTGQLKTKSALDYEMKIAYSVTILVSDGTLIDTITVIIRVINLDDTPFVSTTLAVSDRTPEVRDAIVAAVTGVTDAGNVTDAHLAAITSLSLRAAGITELKSGDFSGMTGLTNLNLYGNMLSSLPLGVFEGLTSLNALRLGGNLVDPLPLIVSLQQIDAGEFQAVVHTGAPFDIVLPIGTMMVTIPQGSLTSASFTDTSTPSIGALPGLPDNHFGYALAKSNVYNRTPAVRDAIVAALSDVNDYHRVTDAHLRRITTLSIEPETLTSLSVGDFDGLTRLRVLNLISNPNLTTLPSGIFDGLIALTKLNFETCGFTSLPSDVFDGLTSLEELILFTNELRTLPAGIFDDLTSLTKLGLSGNRFTTIPSGILVNLTSLTTFHMGSNYNENGALVLYLPLPISLELVQSGEFKAVAPTGAPFDIVVPVNISNGTISGGATSLTISKGSVESSSLTVTATDPNLTVSVGIGTLPGRPAGHTGYVLTKGQAIKVIDNGNAAPIFTDGSSTTRSIAENTASGVNIGSAVAATDADNDRLTYTLAGTDAAAFSILSTSGQLQTNASLDYETKSSYSVTVTATDTSEASNNSASITVTISVTEVNEAPAFASASTTRSVAENTVAGTAIGTVVSATDANNDPLTYTLGGDDAASFDIDSMTGQLKTNAALDFETKSSYSVTVTATDDSEASNNSVSITVTINVTDVNEGGITPVSDRTPLVRDTIVNAIRGIDDPADVTEAHLATITTLSMVSETLTSLSVGDFDGLTGLTYLNVFSSPNLTMLPSGIFDGLTALTKIKFEVCGLTSLPAGIFDDLTSLEELILVLNELSSLPAGIFDDLTALTTLDLSGNRFTTIPSGILVNLTSLTNFYISDNYDENNALIEQLPLPISLELVQSGEFKAVAPTGAPFDIVVPVNISNGTISGGATSVTIPKGSVESSSLTVTATDPNLTVSVGIGTLPGRPSGHNGYVLTKGQAIKVIDNGNAAPIFTDGSSTTRSIAENTASGVNIGSPVDATDIDNEKLTYTLGEADAASFSIVRRTGQLKTKTALDFETKPSYSVTVSVSDGNGGSDSITVIINITDVSETPTTLPTISVSSDSPLTEETLHEGVITLSLSDDTFEQLTASIKDAITLSGITGVYVDTSDVVRVSDTQATVELGYDGNMTTNGNLTISLGAEAIRDYDGAALTSQISVSAVTESVAASTDAALTEATLAGSVVTLTLSGRKYELSNIDIRDAVSVSGVAGVTVSTSDIERISDTEVTIELSFDGDITADGTLTFTVGAGAIANYNGPALTVQVSVSATSTTTPANRAPVFTDGSSTTRTIAENTASGVNIGSAVAATDADTDTLTYTLGGTDAAAFNIVSTSGQLQTNASLDYETKSSYSVTVTATDTSGASNNSASITVTINVTDVNETPTTLPTISVSSNPPLTEETLHEGVITLSLSGGIFDQSAFSIRDAITLSGITDVYVDTSSVVRVSDTQATVELEFYGNITTDSTLTVSLGAEAIEDYDGAALTSQISVSAVTESIAASTDAPLTEATLAGSVVTLTLSGRKYERSDSRIRDAVSVSGVAGVTVSTSDIERISDTEVTIELSFDGDITADGTLTFTVGAGAIASYNGPALTAQASVYAQPDGTIRLTTSTAAPLTEETLHESVITLDLIGGIFDQSAFSIRDAITLSGITDVYVDTSSVVRVSDTQATVELEFYGNITTDSTLTVSLGAEAIEDYDGAALTSQISVSAVTESIAASTDAPLTEATLAGSVVTLTLSGRKYERSDSRIRDAVSVSGVAGVTVSTSDIERISDTEVTIELSFDGDITADGTLTFTVGAGAIASYNGPALTAQASVSATSTTTPANRAPVFTDGSSTTRTIAENTASGVNIGSAVAATDADTDTLTYTLGGTDAAAFSIVSTSGQLQTNASLDYETKISYSVTVSVSDGNSGSDSITVTINITDVNATPTISVSSNPPLTEETLHEGVITLSLSGSTFEPLTASIKDAIILSGTDIIVGIRTFDVERVSDTEVKVELEYDGNMTTNGNLTISLGAEAIKDYDGAALTSQISVSAVTESVAASTDALLTEATLVGSVVTLTLSGRKYELSNIDIRDAVSVSGTSGITVRSFDIARESDTEVTVELRDITNDGTLTFIDGTLTFTVSADAIAGYTGPALTAQVTVYRQCGCDSRLMPQVQQPQQTAHLCSPMGAAPRAQLPKTPHRV